MPKSAIWDAETGFGGNGDPAVDPWTDSSTKKCLVDGPLAGLRPSYTMNGYDEHCLARNWNNGTAFPGDMFASHYTKDVVDSIAALTTYDDFRIQLESGPHGAIHSAVGGDMSPATSPNGKQYQRLRTYYVRKLILSGLPDPIFFLHHAQIDRLWTLWQQQDPETRTMAFAGRRTQDDDSPEATLEDIMPYLGLFPDTKVSEVMATPSSLFCYVY
jgi:tyrosinase